MVRSTWYIPLVGMIKELYKQHAINSLLAIIVKVNLFGDFSKKILQSLVRALAKLNLTKQDKFSIDENFTLPKGQAQAPDGLRFFAKFIITVGTPFQRRALLFKEFTLLAVDVAIKYPLVSLSFMAINNIANNLLGLLLGERVVKLLQEGAHTKAEDTSPNLVPFVMFSAFIYASLDNLKIVYNRHTNNGWEKLSTQAKVGLVFSIFLSAFKPTVHDKIHAKIKAELEDNLGVRTKLEADLETNLLFSALSETVHLGVKLLFVVASALLMPNLGGIALFDNTAKFIANSIFGSGFVGLAELIAQSLYLAPFLRVFIWLANVSNFFVNKAFVNVGKIDTAKAPAAASKGRGSEGAKTVWTEGFLVQSRGGAEVALLPIGATAGAQNVTKFKID